MNFRSEVRSALLLAACGLAFASCSRELPTEPWPLNTDPVVFRDSFGKSVGYESFGDNAKLDALDIDSTEHHAGTASLRYTVPAVGDPTGFFAGGAFVARIGRTLTPYNALAFWVKGSRAAQLDVAGFGNNNKPTARYEARRSGIPVTTSWTRVLVPIPLPELLRDEKGLFYVSEGPEAGAGMSLWLDDVEFVYDATITNPRPALAPRTINTVAGTELNLAGLTSTTFTVAGLNQVVSHMPAYFTFASSDSDVVSPVDGKLLVTGPGTATVTAMLGAIPATGAVTVNASGAPTTPAPRPALPQADVISLFSDVYRDVHVDTWDATWGSADVSELRIAGDTVKVYTNLVFAGVEFTSAPVDASSMAALHLDVWAPLGSVFQVKLVDFGADGRFGGGDDSESELAFDAASTPPFTTGGWVPLDIPFTSFTALTGRTHLAQIVLSGDTRTVFIDNVYFHR